MTAYLFVRLELPSGAKIGPSRAAILEGIERYGSITASARSVGLSYRQVWTTVQVLNSMFDKPLVAVGDGGRTTGAKLTPFGRQVVDRFRKIEDAANKSLRRQIREFERFAGEDPKASAPVPRWAHAELPAKPERKRKG